MDKRVFISLIGVIIFFGVLFAFKKYVLNTCVPPEFALETEHPLVGQGVKFQCTNADGENISWDFGDGKKSSGTETEVEHVYNTTGTYTVIATL